MDNSEEGDKRLKEALAQGYGIDDTPTWDELSLILEEKGYKLLNLDRIEPLLDGVILLKVQDAKLTDRKPDTEKKQ